MKKRIKNLKNQYIIIISLLFFPSLAFAVDCDTPVNPPLVFPSAPNEVWYICQGYNGQISHQGKYALDLSIHPGSIGATGCTPGTANASAGRLVTAPSDGEIVWIGSNSTDIMCFNLSHGGSLKIGHLDMAVSTGQIMSQGDVLGYISVAAPLNGNYAHYHLEPFLDNDCTTADQNGFANMFGGEIDLAPLPLGINQWSGATLSPLCGALPGTAVSPFAPYDPFIPQHPNYVPPAYVAQYQIDIDTTTVITAQSPIIDDSIPAVMVRLVKEGIIYGPWILSSMIVFTGFMFITSMGITTRIMKARRALNFTIIGLAALLSAVALVELMEATLVGCAEIVLRYLV